MTREELKEHCKRQVQQFERVEKLMPVTPNDWKRYEEHKLVLELLEHEPRWTKCSDKLPDMYVNVLGTDKDYGVVVKVVRMLSNHEVAGWEWVLSNDSEGASFPPDEIIAWMPLPEAYKESEEVDD